MSDNKNIYIHKFIEISLKPFKGLSPALTLWDPVQGRHEEVVADQGKAGEHVGGDEDVDDDAAVLSYNLKSPVRIQLRKITIEFMPCFAIANFGL